MSIPNQELVITAVILLGAAFIPSLVYLRWIRNAELYGKQKWSTLFKMFTWGAIFAVIIAVILSLIFLGAFQGSGLVREYQLLEDRTVQTLIIVCVIAPIVEEFTKVLGVFSAKGAIISLEDGFILGAATGLGFAATENLLYESTTFFQDGFQAFVVIVIVRSIASTLLHGSASAVAGYGVSKGYLTNKHSFIPYYLIAVIMHGSFNYLASAGMIYEGRIPILALVAAVFFSIIAITIVRGKITKLDKETTVYYR
ncbi:MAG: PrsW family intramembrane metalloprotease [Candidatus Saliniplasma sp.]